MPTAISPTHKDTDFPNGMNLEQWIEVYASRVKGWQLEPAQYLLDNHPHGAYAVLHIAMSYFESIAKYKHGYCDEGRSRDFFVGGFKWVFADEEYPEQLPNYLYKNLRNGLYHSAQTEGRIVLNANPPKCFQVGENALVINPHLLIPKLTKHFDEYIQELQNNDAVMSLLKVNFLLRSLWIMKRQEFQFKTFGV